ncbi:MAG: hypothetical protein WA830_21410, partial [Candidatus Sulfotelmatobacter sp.]
EYLAKEGRILLEKGLQRLGPLYVEVFHLRTMQELSAKEAAGLLEVPLGTLRSEKRIANIKAARPPS